MKQFRLFPLRHQCTYILNTSQQQLHFNTRATFLHCRDAEYPFDHFTDALVFDLNSQANSQLQIVS